jgi:hypothetical protein
MNLLDQRCLNHSLREAAVQCPSCKRFFCRECVTEHERRMICVSCVAALARSEDKIDRVIRARWTLTALAGILIAWLVFYYLGLTLARIPSEFFPDSSVSKTRPNPIVGRSPWTAADARVGTLWDVPRGQGAISS